MALMKLRDAARELGMCDKFLRELIHRGKVPVYRFGPRAQMLDIEELKKRFRIEPKKICDLKEE